MRKKGDEEKALGGSELALLEEENLDWESVWNRSVASNALPASLRELRCVSTTLTLRSFRGAFVSDKRTCIRSSLSRITLLKASTRYCRRHLPMQPKFVSLASSVLRTNSYMPKLGLFASSTPFVTGRPYTLIFNGSVKSSGAVGLALSGGSLPVAETAFPGLRAITAPLKVTQYVLSIGPPSFIIIRNLDQKET